MLFSMFILQNWRPLKIGGPRRLPILPNGWTGPGCSRKIGQTHGFSYKYTLDWDLCRYYRSWNIALRTCAPTFAYTSIGRSSPNNRPSVSRATGASERWPSTSPWPTAHPETSFSTRERVSTHSASSYPGHWKWFRTMKSSPF